MLQKGKKILLFPVETVVRELDFRLILAALCARPDWQILVGDHEQLFKLSLRLRSVVQVLKNATGGKRPWKYRRYKELGHRIVQLDEEGGIFEGGKESWCSELGKRLLVNHLDAEDFVCTWGPFQADYYRTLNPACAEHIIATGHPRMELGAPRFRELFHAEAEALRGTYGKFVLINTNLLSNNALGPDVLLRWHEVGPEDIELRTRLIEQYGHEARREGFFIQLINHLSNSFPGHRIVVRPHPSEDIRLYRALFRYDERVTIAREGSLHAWLLAASVLVHGGCTTAIEAHLCGTPIVNFQPVKDERFDVRLPNLLGVSCRTPEEVVAAIRDLLKFGVPAPLDADREAALREMLCNFNAQGDSFQRLAEVIGRCQDEAPRVAFTGLSPRLLFCRMRDTVARITRTSRVLRRVFHSMDRGFDKFPPLDRDEVLRKLDIIRGIVGKPVTLTFHSPKIFSITLD
jgi:surface carbohydrate biosynthesis protein